MTQAAVQRRLGAAALEGTGKESALPAGDPALSLIVCTIGRRAELTRLLGSLALQSAPDFEIVLVDQNPPGFLDPLLEPFRDGLRLRHVTSPKGVSLARNAGLAEARGRLVGFPDDDCWFGPDVCRSVLEHFAARPGLDFLTGRTVDGQGRDCSGEFRPNAGPVGLSSVFKTGNANTFFVRREAALAVGGFELALGPGSAGDLQAGEDVDFLIRCVRRGLSVHYDPAFTVFHDPVDEARTEKTLRRVRVYALSFGHLLRRHGLGPGYLAYRLTRSVGGAVLRGARGDVWNARLRLLWARGTLLGYLKTGR